MSKKNQSTLSLDRENLDAQLEAAALKRKKAKRKKIIFRVIGILAVLAVIVVIAGVAIAVAMSKKAMGQMVSVIHAENEELTQEVKINGTVQSDIVQHFYSPTAIKVESVVPVGTFVKKGDPIIKFDSESYELALKQVELSDKIAANNYQSSVTSNNNSLGKLSEAQADVAKYQAEVDEKQAIVDNYDENGKLNQFNKDVQTQIAMEQGTIDYCLAEIENRWIAYKLSVGYDQMSQGEAEQAQKDFEAQPEIKELREKIAYSQSVQNNVSGLMKDKTTDLATAKQELAEAKSKLETAKAQVESYKSASGNQYDRENLKLQGELNTLKSGSAYEELLKYENGCLLAPFDGIVTNSFVSEGMTTSTTNPEIIEFSSINEVSVAVSVGKKDINKIKEGQEVKVTILDKEYDGEISRVSRVALTGNGSSSVTAVIKIKNPDENIFLGIEAKNVIITAHEDSCMTIPSESVNVDADGYFVYVVNDMNIVEKKRVTLGISSEDRTQITEGIDENDKVVAYVTAAVIEGSVVVPTEGDGDPMSNLLGGASSDVGVSVSTDGGETEETTESTEAAE